MLLQMLLLILLNLLLMQRKLLLHATEPLLQYLLGARIRTRDYATADRCATNRIPMGNDNELHSPLKITRAASSVVRPVARRGY